MKTTWLAALRRTKRPSHPLLRGLLFWIGTIGGLVWAAPVSLAGLLIAIPILLFGGHVQLIHRPVFALLFRGPLAGFLLRHHPFGPMNAMAIGHLVISPRQGLSSRVLIHELAHVRQAAHWGIFFPVAYLTSSIWVALRGKNAYWHNRFEIAAREAEKHV